MLLPLMVLGVSIVYAPRTRFPSCAYMHEIDPNRVEKNELIAQAVLVPFHSQQVQQRITINLATIYQIGGTFVRKSET